MDECEVNIQWKNIEACYDFYCPCNPEYPQHVDAESAQDFTCGQYESDDDLQYQLDEYGHKLDFCRRTWHLANRAYAAPGKFAHDGGYGCDGCKTGHRSAT